MHSKKISFRMIPTKLKKFKLVFWGSGGAFTSHEEGSDDEEEELDEIVDQDDESDNVSFTIVPHNNETGDEPNEDHSVDEDMVIPYNKG
jgi:hypothetical protein